MNERVQVFGHVRSGNHLLARLLQRTYFPDLPPLRLDAPATGHWSRRLEPARYELDGEETREVPYAALLGDHAFPTDTDVPERHVYIFRDGRGVSRSCYRWSKLRRAGARDQSYAAYLRTPLDWRGSPATRHPRTHLLWEHWREHVDAWSDVAALRVRYEDLVADPAGTIRVVGACFGLVERAAPPTDPAPVGWNASARPDPFAWTRTLAPADAALFDGLVPPDFDGRCDTLDGVEHEGSRACSSR